jgi:hypothetical protein
MVRRSLREVIKSVLEEKTKRDRCLRIDDRKFDKPSAYKSGAVVRCRQGKIWKGIKEGEYDDQGDSGQFTLVKENPFNIKKLVDKKIIFITKPGDGKGGIEEPNWEGDASVITLYNMAKAEPWMKQAIKSPMPQAISYIQNNQDKLIYNGKYNQILWGIKKMGLKPEDFYLNKPKDLKEFILNNIQEDESLHKWFKRQGPSGKEGGWVDCNTCRSVDGKTKCKSCGRKEGEKRSKYPSCRPTASKCKDPGKGKKWGKTK